MTITSMAPERMSISVISRACSPLSGWETRRLSVSTPSFFAYSASSACSASTKAARPPAFWAWAMTWRESVVFPEDSGPKISTTRPRGMPPTPSAASTASEPVGMTAMACSGRSPRRMIEPLPNWRSICVSAVSTARHFSLDFTLDMSSPFWMEEKLRAFLRDYRLRERHRRTR